MKEQNEREIILTEDDVKNAVTYTPIKAKEEFVDYCYQRCIQKIAVSLSAGGDTEMPDMWAENVFLRSRYMMTALAVLYLGIPMEEVEREDGDLWLMTEREYDRYGRSHILDQMERMKKKPGLQDKVFSMLKDFRDLEKKLSVTIHGTIEVMNDPINRLFQKLSMVMKEMESLRESNAEG